MKFLLTSAGIKNDSIRNALLDLLVGEIRQCHFAGDQRLLYALLLQIIPY